MIYKYVNGTSDRYLVTSSGKVYCTKKKKFLALAKNKHGYITTSLVFNTGRKTVNLHRLVAEVFIDNPNKYATVNHKDGVKSNNRVSNLEWMTRSENTLHAHKNNLVLGSKGSNHHLSKLVNSQVIKIKRELNDGITQKVLAEQFKVSYGTINAIHHGRSWKHVEIN